MLSYIAKRLVIMIPTLIGISIVAFLLITLPPGNYLDTYMAELRRSGAEVDMARIKSLEIRYGVNDPVYVQYWKWAKGFVKGDMGMSFRLRRPVVDLVKERLGWTLIISTCTLIFTWVTAIPIGIYSAVRQYSLFDYIFTAISFIGQSIPSFLLALVLMFLGISLFNVEVGGLMSSQYLGASMSWDKFVDILKHIWVPILVVGTGGMAGLGRVMRGQMLEEMGKHYVKTARSKGISERRVVIKHAARIALNPLLSTAGWILPTLVSGETIVGIVLGLPTLGALLFDALRGQDMYLAGSIIMILSSLVVVGTLISDLLLVLADPRIRFE